METVEPLDDHKANQLVLHTIETELNGEFAKRGTAPWGWFFIAPSKRWIKVKNPKSAGDACARNMETGDPLVPSAIVTVSVVRHPDAERERQLHLGRKGAPRVAQKEVFSFMPSSSW